MFQLKRRDPSDVELDLLRKLLRDAYQMLTGMISVTAHLWASAFFNERLLPKRRRARRKREPIRCCPSNHDEYLRWIDSCRTATLIRSEIRSRAIPMGEGCHLRASDPSCQDRYPSSVGLLQHSWFVMTWIALYEYVT